MAMAAVAEQGMVEAMNGAGPQGFEAVWLLQEERAGVKVRDAVSIASGRAATFCELSPSSRGLSLPRPARLV